jgi:hypothetical protein
MKNTLMNRKEYFVPETDTIIIRTEHTILSGGDQQSGGSENPESGEGF